MGGECQVPSAKCQVPSAECRVQSAELVRRFGGVGFEADGLVELAGAASGDGDGVPVGFGHEAGGEDDLADVVGGVGEGAGDGGGDVEGLAADEDLPLEVIGAEGAEG